MAQLNTNMYGIFEQWHNWTNMYVEVLAEASLYWNTNFIMQVSSATVHYIGDVSNKSASASSFSYLTEMRLARRYDDYDEHIY